MDAMVLAFKVLLLCLSASISGSETALLSLDEEQARRVGPRAQALLARPQKLLSTVLIANVAVNTLFFAYSARGSETTDGVPAWVDGLIALALVVVFGEVLPKNLAMRAPEPIARFAAPFLSALAVLTSPLARVLEIALVPLYRMLGRFGEQEQGISTSAITDALRQSAEQGHLLGDEARFVSAIVRLEDMRVREVMTPRVDLVVLDVSEEGRDEVTRRALAEKVPWVLIVDGNPDAVIGRVRTRNLAVQSTRPVRSMLEPCVFVPEVAPAVAALRHLREQHVAQGVVIDEWGGTAGMVSVETIFEEVVGDLRVEGEAAYQPVVELPDGSFEVDGAFSIRDWNERFGQWVVPREFETLSGLVTTLLGRLPKVGDTCTSGPLEFRVLRMRRRRIERVSLRIVEARAERGEVSS